MLQPGTPIRAQVLQQSTQPNQEPWDLISKVCSVPQWARHCAIHIPELRKSVFTLLVSIPHRKTLTNKPNYGWAIPPENYKVLQMWKDVADIEAGFAPYRSGTAKEDKEKVPVCSQMDTGTLLHQWERGGMTQGWVTCKFKWTVGDILHPFRWCSCETKITSNAWVFINHLSH